MAVIKELVCELGRKVRGVEEIAEGYSEDEIERMHQIGLEEIPTDNERMLCEMIQNVCGKITQKPDCVLVAHSLPFIRRERQDMELCWQNIPIYYFSGVPCAIMHKAVEAAAFLVEKKRIIRYWLLALTKLILIRNVFFGTIMGDGVVALLLEKGEGPHQILSSLFLPESWRRMEKIPVRRISRLFAV